MSKPRGNALPLRQTAPRLHAAVRGRPPTVPATAADATVVTGLSTAITLALVQQEDTAALAQQEAPASAPEPTSAHAKWDLPVAGAQEFQLTQA